MKINDLINAGAHFGHPVRKWNPHFKEFIISKKNGVHIIDMDSTIKYLDKATKELTKIVLSGGNILFVGTKSQAKDAVQNQQMHLVCFILLKDGLVGL